MNVDLLLLTSSMAVEFPSLQWSRFSKPGLIRRKSFRSSLRHFLAVGSSDEIEFAAKLAVWPIVMSDS